MGEAPKVDSQTASAEPPRRGFFRGAVRAGGAFLGLGLGLSRTAERAAAISPFPEQDTAVARPLSLLSSETVPGERREGVAGFGSRRDWDAVRGEYRDQSIEGDGSATNIVQGPKGDVIELRLNANQLVGLTFDELRVSYDPYAHSLVQHEEMIIPAEQVVRMIAQQNPDVRYGGPPPFLTIYIDKGALDPSLDDEAGSVASAPRKTPPPDNRMRLRRAPLVTDGTESISIEASSNSPSVGYLDGGVIGPTRGFSLQTEFVKSRG